MADEVAHAQAHAHAQRQGEGRGRKRRPAAQWRVARFKDRADVWVECKPDGMVPRRGRVRMVYGPGGKVYRAHRRNVSVVEPPRIVSVGEGKKFQELEIVPAGLSRVLVEKISEDAVLVYTDGSTQGMRRRSAAAACIIDGEREWVVTRELELCGSDRAELEAVLLGLESLESTDRPVAVITDSQYVVWALRGRLRFEKYGALVAEIVARLEVFPSWSVIKIKGHSGVRPNEVADKAARACARGRQAHG